MIIKGEEIVGGFVGGDLVCLDCLTKDEFKRLTADKILTEHAVSSDDEMFFCDRCEERIEG